MPRNSCGGSSDVNDPYLHWGSGPVTEAETRVEDACYAVERHERFFLSWLKTYLHLLNLA
jgi:hypothetical protein